jgi:hypothetical protein
MAEASELDDEVEVLGGRETVGALEEKNRRRRASCSALATAKMGAFAVVTLL